MKKENVKEKKDKMNYDEFCEKLYDVCMEALNDDIDMADIVDGVSVVKNKLLFETLAVTAEIISDDKIKEKMAELEMLSRKTNKNSGVCV